MVKPWGGRSVPRVPRASETRRELPPPVTGGPTLASPPRLSMLTLHESPSGALQETWSLFEPREPLGGDRLVAKREEPGP